MMRNSCTGLAIGLMALPGVLALQISYESHILSIAGCLSFVLGYLALYARMTRHNWKYLFVTPPSLKPDNLTDNIR